MIKIKSSNPCVAYFVNQAKGKGRAQLGDSLPRFQGARMHECMDLVTCLENCSVLPYPLLSGTTLLDTDVNIMKDVDKGRNFRKSLEKQRKQGGLELLNEMKTQIVGSQSQKRKRVIKDPDHSRSKNEKVSKEAKGIKGVAAFQVRQPQSMQVYRDISATLDKLKSLSEWHTSCLQAQVNVLFTLWISSTYHQHRPMWNKEPGSMFIRYLLFQTLNQLDLSLKGNNNKSFSTWLISYCMLLHNV